jgi:hypothetical protein
MSVTSPTTPRPGRKLHRVTCVAAGGLALLGGGLGLFVSPWFLTLAVAGGVWLVASGLWSGTAEPSKTCPPAAPPIDPTI